MDVSKLKVGDKVTVLPAYVGNGRRQADSVTGERYIVRIYKPIPGYSWYEFKVARHPDGPWQSMIHECRLTGK